MYSKSIRKHNNSKYEYRIHGTVFQENKLFNALNIVDCQFPDHKSAKAVAEQNQWNGKGKRKGAKHTVN